MRKVLYFLSHLHDRDLDWLTGAGKKEEIRAGGLLVSQGAAVEKVYVLLEGKLQVVVGSNVIATLGSGELVGELSFLDERPASASVVVAEQGSVLAISKKRLKTKVRTDDAFGNRFYHALGVLVSDRLRTTVASMSGNPSEAEADELSEKSLEQANLAAARFNRLLQQLL